MPSRSECGLPEKAFVFCCFNNNYKIMPEIFDIWTQALSQRSRQRLAGQGATCALFDTGRVTRQIEAAYVMMWERYQKGRA
jgi:predicted O-linked N-acetylglucosamine transferase (SPINDLY family)